MDDIGYVHSRALPHVSVHGSVPPILKIIKHGDLCNFHPGMESGTSPVERNLRVCCPLYQLTDKGNHIKIYDTVGIIYD